MTKIDQILTDYNLNNHALVAAYAEQGKNLSHKTIQKARLGTRPLSRKMQMQVIEALNAAVMPEKPFKRDELFPQDPATAPIKTKATAE